MQQKLCLWLAVAVLIGALVAGNPFLEESRDARATRAAPSTAPTVEPAAAPIGGASLAVERRPTHDAGAARDATLVSARSSRAVEPVSLRAAVAERERSVPCPDAALQSLVVAVERDAAGEPIWVLRDGRRFAANPKRGAGEPLLVAVGDGDEGK